MELIFISCIFVLDTTKLTQLDYLIDVFTKDSLEFFGEYHQQMQK